MWDDTDADDDDDVLVGLVILDGFWLNGWAFLLQTSGGNQISSIGRVEANIYLYFILLYLKKKIKNCINRTGTTGEGLKKNNNNKNPVQLYTRWSKISRA